MVQKNLQANVLKLANAIIVAKQGRIGFANLVGTQYLTTAMSPTRSLPPSLPEPKPGMPTYLMGDAHEDDAGILRAGRSDVHSGFSSVSDSLDASWWHTTSCHRTTRSSLVTGTTRSLRSRRSSDCQSLQQIIAIRSGNPVRTGPNGILAFGAKVPAALRGGK